MISTVGFEGAAFTRVNRTFVWMVDEAVTEIKASDRSTTHKKIARKDRFFIRTIRTWLSVA